MAILEAQRSFQSIGHDSTKTDYKEVEIIEHSSDDDDSQSSLMSNDNDDDNDEKNGKHQENNNVDDVQTIDEDDYDVEDISSFNADNDNDEIPLVKKRKTKKPITTKLVENVINSSSGRDIKSRTDKKNGKLKFF